VSGFSFFINIKGTDVAPINFKASLNEDNLFGINSGFKSFTTLQPYPVSPIVSNKSLSER
jgi:hypothetical protein